MSMKQQVTKKNQTDRKKTTQRAAKMPLSARTKRTLLQLQRTFGNHGVLRRYPGVVQAKLTIGQTNDRYEQEADRMADLVMRMSESRIPRQPELEEKGEPVQTRPTPGQITRLVQGREEEKGEGEGGLIQTKAVSGPAPEVTPDVKARISGMRGRGRLLPNSTRAFFEARFGYDFSQVRVHSDTEADTLNRTLNARAFTSGNDIFFRQGGYNPGGSGGRRLLAHELTHTIQQNQVLHAGSEIRRKDEVPKAKDKVEKKLSGPDWYNEFPTSRKTDDLASGFKENVEKFLESLKDSGASVTISATKRPTERAHLMHYSYKLSKNKLKCDKIPSKTGVNIQWCHKDAKGNIDHEASRKAAEKMVKKYGIAYAPSLTSLHIQGKAIDMTISWSGNLTIKDHSGKEVIIKTTPRNGNNTRLHEVGKGYGVKKLVSDPPHWSSTGG